MRGAIIPIPYASTTWCLIKHSNNCFTQYIIRIEESEADWGLEVKNTAVILLV